METLQAFGYASVMRSTITQFPAWRSRQNSGLADLYGVEYAILQTGMRLTVNHGRTDEGDPWISVHQYGDPDVLAHIAIIDGAVVADSPTFMKPVRAGNIASIIKTVLSAIRTNAPERKVSGFDVFTAIIVAAAALHISDADAFRLPFDAEHLPEIIRDLAPVQIMALAEVAQTVSEAASGAMSELVAAFQGDMASEVQTAAAAEPWAIEVAVGELSLELDRGETINVPQVVIDIASATPERAVHALTQEEAIEVVASLTPNAQTPSEDDAKSEIYQILASHPDAVEMQRTGSNIDFYVTGYDGEKSFQIGDLEVRMIGVEEGGAVPELFGAW